MAPLLDSDNLARHIAEGRIARKVNADGYVLLNYTQRAQYEGAWDHETLTCRGLVLDPDGTVQSRPFPKFFNLYEHTSPNLPDLPVEPFTVHEKVDGSLIIVSVKADGTPMVTTRGSFDSKQATEAERMITEQGLPLPPAGVTWLLELVAPWNRIVVNYGDRTDLVFLAAIDNATGQDVGAIWPGPIARMYDGLADFDAITAMLDTLGPNDEGFVLRFASGVRAKAKGAEYMRLHKLLTGITARTIHDLLSKGTGLAEVVDRVPDEFMAWVKATADGLTARYKAIEADARVAHDQIVGLPTRKDQAMAIKDSPQKSVVFSMLDGKDYAPAIWRQIRPEPGLPFAMDGTES